jgi:hypothetical protein
LNSSEAAEFPTLWRELERSKDFRFIEVAIRRFGYAGERNRPDDRLVDLIIAAESLFLSDTAEAGERGELRFRLALRFAYYVDSLPLSRPVHFRHMRAYDARSALVHGGEPDPKILSLPGQGRFSLETFVESVNQSLRLALIKAVSTPQYGNKQLVDWDSLILG